MSNETDKNESAPGDAAEAPESESAGAKAPATPEAEPSEASIESDAEPSASDVSSQPSEPPAEGAADAEPPAEGAADAEPPAEGAADAEPSAEGAADAEPGEGSEDASEGEAGEVGDEEEGKEPRTRGQKARRGALLLGLLLSVTFLVLKFLVGFEGGGGVSTPNLIAVGPAAPVGGELVIEVAEPLELDAMKRQGMMALRAEAVTRQPRLLVGDYSPNNNVFSGLADGLSWWGVDGWRIHGPGEKAGEGVSRDSWLLMNPFILVGLEVSFTRWADWQVTRDNFVEEDMPTMDGCLGPYPKRLTWNPQDRTAEVVYGYRDYREAFREMLHVVARRTDLIRLPRFKTGIQFSAVNARDLGFNYMRMSVRESGRAELEEGQEVAHDLPPAPWPIQLAALMEEAAADAAAAAADAAAAAADGGDDGHGEPAAEGAAKEGDGHGEEKKGEGAHGEEKIEEEAKDEVKGEVSKEAAATVLPVFEITDHFGATSECSIPGIGCQGIVGQSSDLVEGLDVLAIPAQVTFHLWRDKPEGEIEPPPDMRFIVTMK
jgi:hypothetical protein